eukprot:gene4502-biopygen21995
MRSGQQTGQRASHPACAVVAVHDRLHDGGQAAFARLPPRPRRLADEHDVEDDAAAPRVGAEPATQGREHFRHTEGVALGMRGLCQAGVVMVARGCCCCPAAADPRATITTPSGVEVKV